MKKQDKRYILIMGILVFILGGIFFFSPYIFGSKTDWLGQHIAFPDYFRSLFYQTGDLFPSFSMHLGGGQNIFNFSYYGLFNPIILVSYLLPFVSMKDYIIVTSLLGVFVSMVLLYHFLKTKLNQSTSFICCLLYFLACPVFFHAHRHIMFVSYMPFLIWGLIAVDCYFKEKKTLGLTLSAFFMILTSYYYSIGGICVLVIYGIHCWLKENKFKTSKFIKEGLQFLLPIIFGVLLSAFFLLPTAYCLLSGREGSPKEISFLSLFLPNFNLDQILYTSYSIGLTSIFILALLSSICHKKRENKWLGIILFIICFFPIFIYLLNGTLYVRAKSLIPFLPLAVYLIGIFLEDIFAHKVSYFNFGILLLIFHLTALFSGFHSVAYYVDLLIMLVVLFLFHKYHKDWLFYVPLVVTAFVVMIAANVKDDYVKKTYSDSNIEKLIRKIPTTDSLWRTSIQTNTLYGINQIYSSNHYSTSLYSSVYNNEYSNFFKNTFENALPYRNRLILGTTSNFPFQVFMGERYLISTCQKNFIGYTKIAYQDNVCLYENSDVYPLGYGSSNILSQKDFDNLSYPYSMEALFNAIIVSDASTTKIKNLIHEIPFAYETKEVGKNLMIAQETNGYTVTATDKDKIIYTLKEPLQNQLLLIDFNVVEEPSCNDGDLTLTMNDITNKLTCSSWEYKNQNHRFTYILSENNLDKLEITFSKGTYRLEDFHIYTWDYADVVMAKDTLYPFVIDRNESKGDTVVGNIEMEEDGYFALSIPYDEGFAIKVDGKRISYEKVNTAFLGFPLKKGNHLIEIVYEAPYYNLGKIVSNFTLVILLVYSIYQKRYQK